METQSSEEAWILSWHYDLIGLSTLLLATMLVLLILITRTILRGNLSTRERLFVRLPFSVYFGWIAVATIANITVCTCQPPASTVPTRRSAPPRSSASSRSLRPV